ncbi:hypothetical protein [Candidatus Finniella inopinata]|uniref:Uncharacterized protein n=1 Tax=Candidatus Finniella inopinata TaxID=1696036 RepID=A0A4Q7DKZ9_9PROT|nr:hypothetical protein [Candidatus Finniella inopinata]RZI46814.1 hypothetical protein EQU50_00890 [Candidatus Finniella inopinata]
MTRPYDAIYGQAGVEKGSGGDRYKDRFRLLGNKIVELGFGPDIDKISFVGSPLERLFGEVTTQLTNVGAQPNNHSSESSAAKK